jgi:hypothetical protein
MNDTTTVRARFTSCAEVRSFFADRYHGMVINERMVAKTCENHGLSYTPPERASDDNLNDWWELTA